MFASIVLFIALIIASYTDLRWTEVPDWLSYSTIITGLVLYMISSIQTASATPVLHSLAGFASYSALGLSLFYLGQWGGGDAKLLMGAGALIGFSPSLTSDFILYPLSIIVIGGAYSLIWTIIIGIKHFSTITRAVRNTYGRRNIVAIQLTLVILGAILGILGYLVSTNPQEVIVSAILGLLIPTSMILFIGLKSIELHCFKRDIHPRDLIEGDWIVNPVKKNGRVIYKPTNIGILAKDIEALRESRITSVTIKSGIPFTPAMMLAYIPLLFI